MIQVEEENLIAILYKLPPIIKIKLKIATIAI
jgi:hypothetical protein